MQSPGLPIPTPQADVMDGPPELPLSQADVMD
jgi:hypothetical protein